MVWCIYTIDFRELPIEVLSGKSEKFDDSEKNHEERFR